MALLSNLLKGFNSAHNRHQQIQNNQIREQAVDHIKHIGSILAIGSVTGKNYIDNPGVHRSLMGDGVATTLAGFLGGMAGVLITPITTLRYDVGVLLGLKGFAAAILGGFGSFPGAIVGGVALGLLESLGAAYVSSVWKDTIAFLVLLLVLFVRPHGLFGKAVRP